MAQLDEGVGNLERFCALLTSTNGALQEHTTGLEGDAGELERLTDSAEAILGELGDQLHDLASTVKERAGEATAALEGVGTAARAATDERLATLEQHLGETHSGFEQRLDADQASLESDSSELAASGFEPLAGAIDTVQGGVEGSRQSAQEAFSGLEGALDGLEQQMNASEHDTVAGIVDAAQELEGEVTEGLGVAGAECAAAWADELPSELAGQCSGVEGSVGAAYASFGEESLGEGDALIEHVTSAADEAADFLLNVQGGKVEASGNAVVEEAFPPLLDQLANVADILASSIDLVNELEPMVAELEIAKVVVVEVDQLLSEIGG